MRTLVLDVVDSTNNYLKRLIETYDDISDLIVVKALEQTKGRGRLDRSWFSSLDSLTFSVLLYYSEDSYQISLITALSVLFTIKEYGIDDVYIKWPNDVYVMDKKVAGILLESINKYVIVGIGVNINQDNFPEELSNAISLKIAKGCEIDKDNFYQRLINNFLKYYKEWLINPAKAMSIVKEHIGWIGKKVKVINGLEGVIEGIDINGFLLLKTPSKTIKVGSGELICLQE